MPPSKQTIIQHSKKNAPLTPQEKQERKQRVLTHGTPSVTRSIADAVVVKNGNVFLLTEVDGSMPLENGHGFGLYYHDCRYLNGYELKLAGASPQPLVSNSGRGSSAVFQLANPDLRQADGKLIHKESLGIKWKRSIDGETLSLYDEIAIQNFGVDAVEFPLALAWQAGFEDVYIVRELLDEKLGEIQTSGWSQNNLRFIYKGADGIYRSVTIHCAPAPDETNQNGAQFQIKLQPQEIRQIRVTLRLAESRQRDEIEPKVMAPAEPGQIEEKLDRDYQEWRQNVAAVSSDSLLFNRILDRSFRDLHVLTSRINNDTFFIAGVPWFATLFGRDSIVTAMQMLAFNPTIAEQTLRVLARYQGRRVDNWHDEQPGKILHEIRAGELARMGEIPHTPYFGTVDATPLFLFLLSRHAAWTGDLKLFNELRQNVEAALDWMSQYGDGDGDGFIEYESTSEKGLINQGWKDSGDAIVDAEGKLAQPPIALVEVQGYAYLAKNSMADLFERAGEKEKAERLRAQAKQLRSKFNQEYWMEEKRIYALALQADKRLAAVVSSNSGHALWAGIADDDKARRTMERLMASDMFTGWGIRTLSGHERRFNPLGYHLGTVWPHDNAMIAAGFRRYGFDEAAHRIFDGMVEAAMNFEGYQLPELFAGYSREEFGVPVRYPVACHPQAWAAGTMPYFMEIFLGLMPEAFDQRLRIVRPMLPKFIDRITVHRLKVGQAEVDLKFERNSSGETNVVVLNVEGKLDVQT